VHRIKVPGLEARVVAGLDDHAKRAASAKHQLPYAPPPPPPPPPPAVLVKRLALGGEGEEEPPPEVRA
jgi:hypothetical protein